MVAERSMPQPFHTHTKHTRSENQEGRGAPALVSSAFAPDRRGCGIVRQHPFAAAPVGYTPAWLYRRSLLCATFHTQSSGC